MMTLSELKTGLERALQLDLDHEAGENPSGSELTASINKAIRFISAEIYQIDPSITLDLTTDDGTIDLRDTDVVSRKVIEPLVVIIAGNPLSVASGRKYGMWTLSEIQAYCPTWRSDSSGTPSKAAFHDRTLYLHPAPNSTNAALSTHYIMGQYLAADMVDGVDDSSYPDIPEELHEDIVRLAAVFAADSTVSEGEALARLGRYEARAKEKMAQIRTRNRRTALSWGTVTRAAQPRYIQL